MTCNQHVKFHTPSVMMSYNKNIPCFWCGEIFPIPLHQPLERDRKSKENKASILSFRYNSLIELPTFLLYSHTEKLKTRIYAALVKLACCPFSECHFAVYICSQQPRRLKLWLTFFYYTY